MSNAANSSPERTNNPERFRELHTKYWMISTQGDSKFPHCTMDQFVEFMESMNDDVQSEYITNLCQRYEQAVEQAVAQSMQLIEEYAQPETDGTAQ